MIKVLMVGNHPSSKGGMTSVINQIKEHDWQQDGIELLFIPTFMPGNLVKKSLFFICAYFKILWMFLFNKPDIVHMHMSYRGSFKRKNMIHKLCRTFSVKDIIHLHGSEFVKWYNTANIKTKGKVQCLFKECNTVIVLGKNWEKIICDIVPLVNTKVIHNCIAIPTERAKWNDCQCEVLYLGVLTARKGISDLLDAVGLLVKEGKIGNLHFTIAGIGEEKENLIHKSIRLGIDRFITFVGWVDGEKKEYFLKNSQIFVLPSYNEGLPVSILEAASYGMPVVATDVGDIASVVKDGLNGVLFTPGDIFALRDGIFSLNDQAKWEKFACAAKKIIRDNFSIDIFYSKLCDVWKNVAHEQ